MVRTYPYLLLSLSKKQERVGFYTISSVLFGSYEQFNSFLAGASTAHNAGGGITVMDFP